MDISRLQEALINADRAGDEQAARLFAAQIREIQNQQQAPQSLQPQTEERGVLDEVVGGLETAGTILSGAIAEPVAGVAGIAQSLNPFAGPGAGAEAVETVREALTLTPDTPEAQRNLQAIGEVIEPAAEAFGTAEDFLGDATLEATGSPALAAAAKTAPTALLTALGIRGGRKSIQRKSFKEIDSILKEATPDIEDLKEASRTIYRDIEDAGVTVKESVISDLSKNVEKAARKSGARPRTSPQAYGIIDEFKALADDADVSLDEIDQLRTLAQDLANSPEPSVRSPGLAIIDEIDGFLDDAGDAALNKPKGLNIGREYQQARHIWGRARKAEVLEEVFDKAANYQSGFESGLRNQAKNLLNNKRRIKFFNAKEKDALRQISQGTKASNLAKLVGRLGLSEGQAVNMLNPLVGGGVGFAVGGPAAAVLVPGVGQLSKGLASKLTAKNGRLAEQVIKAGENAEIITKAYINNVPKGQRSALELSELLIRNQVDLGTAKSAFAKEAADVAKQLKTGIERGGRNTVATIALEEKEDG